MKSKTVVIGIASSIAAFKVIDLVRDLKKDGINVITIMTKNAALMVNPHELEKASGNKVYVDLFEKNFDYKKILKERQVDHINIADKADLFIVIPATANTIAKIASGIADDFLTTTLLATQAPIMICPAMNVNMWNNPLVNYNIKKLKKFGYQIIEPTEGMLACGYTGRGKLQEISLIKKEIKTILNRRQILKGRKIIVTAGATIEKIDDVRFITNHSSGKMGTAIAEECYLAGAEVLLLLARNAEESTYKIKTEYFSEATELLNLLKKHISDYDTIYHTAAVGDFKPQFLTKGKISSSKKINVHFIPQIKISDMIKTLKPSIKLILFKAEYGLTPAKLIQSARKKLNQANADVVIANDVSSEKTGFGSNFNQVIIVQKNEKDIFIPLADKKSIARQILKRLSLNNI